MDDTGSFFDAFAAVRDARFDQQTGESLPADVGFYRDLATEASGPALQVAVGTGRVYLELLDAGLDVDGFDLSEQSLNRLRSKATDRGLSPTVWVDDATDFDVDREYGLIYAPARAFNYLHTIEKQKQALQSIRDALAPGGRFALNTFIPRFDAIQEYGESHANEVTIDGEQYRIVRTTFLDDEVEQVTRTRRELYHEGELVAERETPFALIPKRQFELLFEATGFSDWTVTGDFDGSQLDSAEQEMVWVVDV
jgi:SAM-dependent methyltransferase